MKKVLPWIAFVGALAFICSGLWIPQSHSPFDLENFGRIPVLVNGRIKPLDTVARTSLLEFQDRQMVYLKDATRISPMEWLLDVAFRPEKSDTYPTFTIDNPEVLGLIGKTEEDLKIHYPDTARQVLAIFDFVPKIDRRFSYETIFPYFTEIERQAQLAQSVEAQQRTPFQRAVLALYNHLVAYQQIKYSFVSPDTPDFLNELRNLQTILPKGLEAVRAKRANQPHDEELAQAMVEVVNRFDTMARFASLFVVPPQPGSDKDGWHKMGQELLDVFKTGELSPPIQTFATLEKAWRSNDSDLFNSTVQRYHEHLLGTVGDQLKKTNGEVRFNMAQPFYQSMIIYALAFAVAITGWFFWPELLGRGGFYLVVAAYLATTAGILTRMWLEGRPPVTNLYSSALFVGWVAVGLCIILEKVYENGVGTVAAGALGFCTLMIAHHLSFGGDTLEMMRAVLDNNFWLATHVVVVTMGYGSTFLAGFLGLIYIVMGVFTKWLPQQFDRRAIKHAEDSTVVRVPFKKSAAAKDVPAEATPETNGQAIVRMIYGIVCFATLFSLVGTILGGIWADQSWGRFWGWDPKENGALIIVIWNSLILHARWGGFVKARGMACLAVFGNVVTSWSWFGTNMLGIGLHSYGFMDAAFYWLIAFVLSQVLIIALANVVPLQSWRSFRKDTKESQVARTGNRAPAR
ncbi:MAG TPA: cytochrome c biogenesis protein CcsA [Opitutaceae bacterium]